MGDLNKWQKFLLWSADRIPNIQFTKDLAYKIISDRQVGYQAGATKQDIIRNLMSDIPKDEDTNKYMFVYGADTRRPETSIGQAYDWADDIKENEYQNVKSYEGVLNPYGEYLVDSRNKGLVEALAKAKYSPVSNINNEYIDWNTFRMKKGVPYYDDVHGYRPTFHYDQNGNAVVSSSDLYDFGKNYVGDFTDLYAERSGNENDPAFTMELQRRALNSVGQPYLLVQKNIPIRYVDNPQGDEIWRVNNFNKELRLDEMSDEEIASITKTGYIKPVVVTNKKGGILKYQNSGKFDLSLIPDWTIPRNQHFVAKEYDPNAPLNWDAKAWLNERADNDRGLKYTDEDIRIFESHVPEYKEIEKTSKENGTWLMMSDGTKWVGDPREWVVMQSKAFKKNYQDNPWYTGQAEWETKVTLPDGSTVDSNKVKRARYHNGEMWFSNDAGYAQYFADTVGREGLGIRGQFINNPNYKTDHNIKGTVFLAGIPKTGNYRKLEGPKTGYDHWRHMPFILTETGFERTNEKTNLLTDDLVSHSRKLGDNGLFLFNVNDGPVLRNKYKENKMLPYFARPGHMNNDPNSRLETVPINEFISQPGFTEKIKFIRGNNGNFDPNTDDKYSAIFKTDSPLFAKKGGRIHIKKKNRGKFTEYCGGKVTEECIRKGKNSPNPLTRKRAAFAGASRTWKHENGGILKYQNPAGPLLESKDTLNTSYLAFKRTLPDNLRLTPEKDYHMYDYWKLNGEPKNFREGKRRGMFTWDRSDKGYHAGSIAEDRNTGIYHFMKPKHHPTVKYELDWFNKGLQTLEGGKQVPVEGKDKEFWEDFTSKYQLDTTGADYRYVPIRKNGGILKYQNPAEPIPQILKTAATFPDWLRGTWSYLSGNKDSKLLESQYRPTKETNPNTKYYYRDGLNTDVIKNILGGSDYGKKNRFGENLYYKDFNDVWNRLSAEGGRAERNTDNSQLGAYTIGIGEDNKGRYISYYDKFDWAPAGLPEIFHPYEIYNRIYEDEFNNTQSNLKNITYSGYNPSGNWFFKSGSKQYNNVK